MSMKRMLCLLAGVLSLSSGIANAEVLTFRFTGTVTYGGTMATVGEQVTGHFCYDTDAIPEIKLEGYASYQVPQRCKIVVRVGTHKASAKHVNASVWNNFGGNVEDMIDVYGSSAVEVDGTTYPNGIVGFRLASGPGKTGVFRSVNLRERFKVEKFDAMNYGEVLMDGTGNGTLLAFTITSIKLGAD